MTTYCFKISNPTDGMDVDKLVNFVENLYIGSSDIKFNKSDTLPYVVIYSESDQSICVNMTSVAKKNIAKIVGVNKKLSKSKLLYNKIQLEKPLLFSIDTVAWWDGKAPNIKGERWQELIHKGPYFPALLEPYTSLGGKLKYKGKLYKLTSEEERIASFYAKRMISERSGGVTEELTKDNSFNNNFWTDFKTYLSKDNAKIFKNFSDIGWENLISKINNKKEYEVTADEKRAKKTKNAKILKDYGYATIDGNVEKLKTYKVELASIFYGRGKHKSKGRIKRDVIPEDVTINIGKNSPVPKPPPGHKWGNVIHNKNVMWLARWHDSIARTIKYVYLSDEGHFKGKSDLVKYEKARKLNKYIKQIRERYMVDASASDETRMEFGTALYLIETMGIRVGNETGLANSETFGATTLLVGHIKTKAPNKIIFDFLGKDSIRFYKEIKVPKEIYKNFIKLTKGRKPNDELFSKIDSKSLNSYIREFDSSFSSKVFRTRLASSIMNDAIKKVNIPSGSNKQRTKQLFNEANKKVAEVLNHIKNISKNAELAVEKLKNKLKELKKEYKKLKKEKSAKVPNIKERIKKMEENIKAKTNVMSVAMGTSLINYIDPRIVVAWSKKEDADLSAIYTKTLMKKFRWAIDSTPKNWSYTKTALIGNSALTPADTDEPAVSIGKRNSRDKSKKGSKKGAKKSLRKGQKKNNEVSGRDILAWLRNNYGLKWYNVSEIVKNSRKDEANKAILLMIKNKKTNADIIKAKTVQFNNDKIMKWLINGYGDDWADVSPKVLEERKNLALRALQYKKLDKKLNSSNPQGSVSDYKLLLEICEDPIQKTRMINVSKEALAWIYPFAKYAKNKGDLHNGDDIAINNYIINFYDAAYK